MNLSEILGGNPIIAAVRRQDDFEDALSSKAGAIFMLSGELSDLADMVKAARLKGKPIFLHMELIGGLSQDMAAVRFVAQKVNPTGIITTRSHLISFARKAGLLTIQRLFILDSLAVKTGITTVLNTKPDAVEVLPGILPRFIGRLASEFKQPLIAGGLIESEGDILDALNAGAIAVSSSRKELWDFGEKAW